MSPDRQLLVTLAALRRQWRTRILLESLVWIVAAVLLAVVVTMLVLRANPGAHAVTAARAGAYALLVATVVRSLVLPLSRRASDERFALYVEERAPELRQSLLTAVQEAHTPESERLSAPLAARLMARATGAIRPLQERMALEKPRMQRAGGGIGVLTLVAVGLLLLGPDALRTSARLLFVPWSTAEAATPVRRVAVRPGNATVPRGGAIEIRAALVGFASDGAELVFRADSASEWTRLPMAPDADSTGFRSRLFDLTKPTEYYIESADVRSPIFHLAISDLPAVQRVSVELRFPSYSGLPPERIDDGGDVAAVVGTSVTVRARTTRAVKGGSLHFDDGTTVAMARDTSGALVGTFRVRTSGFYRVDIVSTEGATVTGAVEFVVDAIPDRAPTVRIESPGRDTKVTSVEEVAIAVRADDDLGVASMELRYQVNGGEEKRVTMRNESGLPRDARSAYTIFLEELGLKAGDLVAYHAVAKDGAGHQGSSDVYFLEVRPFGKNYRQAEQQGGGGDGGGQQESPEGFVARQREVVAGTFNWLRDSASTAAKKRREDVTTLTIAEGRLREDVATLSGQLAKRGVAEADTMFAKIKLELDTAILELKGAEELLARAQGREAMPGEQRALQHLQRAEALYRDVQVQMGQQQGGGGGGGGQQPKAEDLADLFSLETDKLRNQYEAVQQQSGSPQAAQSKQVDETLEKLKQLANRQQQENERMQRMADALREKMGQNQSAGGGGGAQRELARQAEEEARRLERLSREQKSQELADAAQKMQQAADAMRRAASGSASQGSAALEALNKATRNLESTKASGANAGIQRLADKAKELEARQKDIAEGVQQAQAASGADRDEQLRRLAEKKDVLKGDIGRLEAEAERLSREGRREQPKAAGKLGEAADAIRDTRLRDKVEFSKSVMRGGSPEYANGFEAQIADNLKDVADRAREAAGSLSSEPAGRRQERALDRTRSLVEGLESLRARTADRSGQNGQQGQPQGSQQGQQQGSQQGQAQQGQQNGGKQGSQGKQQDSQGQQGQQGQGQRGQQGGQQPGRQGRQQGGQTGGQRQQAGQPSDGNGGGRPTGMPTGAAGRTNGVAPDDSRQLASEFRLRRENAEQLRAEMRRQGLDTRELDNAIEGLRRLEQGRAFGDPKGLDQLQAAVIEGLKTFEFGLARSLGLGAEGKPAAGARAAVPAEYRTMVEEYYRALAGTKKR